MSQNKAKTISEFAKLELSYPISEWEKDLLKLKKSDRRFIFCYGGRRRTNLLSYYLLEQALEKIEVNLRKKPKIKTVENKGQITTHP